VLACVRDFYRRPWLSVAGGHVGSRARARAQYIRHRRRAFLVWAFFFVLLCALFSIGLPVYLSTCLSVRLSVRLAVWRPFTFPPLPLLRFALSASCSGAACRRQGLVWLCQHSSAFSLCVALSRRSHSRTPARTDFPSPLPRIRKRSRIALAPRRGRFPDGRVIRSVRQRSRGRRFG
jgi:hypothetical protein